MAKNKQELHVQQFGTYEVEEKQFRKVSKKHLRAYHRNMVATLVFIVLGFSGLLALKNQGHGVFALSIMLAAFTQVAAKHYKNEITGKGNRGELW